MEKVFQISEFNEFISTYLKQVGEVTVEGEISELKPYQDKFLYITLKDAGANLNVFAVTYNISGWRSLAVGMKVQASGTPGLYQKSGKFTFNATHIIPSGEGALKLAYEKLRLQLEKEGLFDVTRKRRIPQFPRRVALLTARGSDAYNDFVKVLGARFGGIKIYFLTVQVQGREAPDTIVQAFNYLNQSPDLKLDCVILTRGGGSLEDLQAFNDERVVRAVFSSNIPVICGVGHEKDVSLCDLAADLRASTPSNAAELLVRHKDEYLKVVDHARAVLHHYLGLNLSHHHQRLSRAIGALDRVARQPQDRFHQLSRRLAVAQSSLSSKIAQDQLRATNFTDRSFRALQVQLQKSIQNHDHLLRLLKSFDPQQIIKRGFSLTTSADGHIISSVSDLSAGNSLTTQFADGKIVSVISHISHDTNI